MDSYIVFRLSCPTRGHFELTGASRYIFSVRCSVGVYSGSVGVLSNVDVFPVFLRNDAFLLCPLADLCFRYGIISIQR